jgi:hypothetical protein
MPAELLLTLPAVPAADPVLDPVLPVDEALPEPEPMRAFVSIHCPLLLDVDAVLPAVPLVPVAADDPLPPVRQPVTVTLPVLLDRELWLPAVDVPEVDEPACVPEVPTAPLVPVVPDELPEL